MLRSTAVLLAISAFSLPAQTGSILDINRNGWYSYSGDHQVQGRWGVHFDGQYRRANVITRWQQYQLRPGLNFQAAPNVLLTLGYVYTRAYPYGDFPIARAFPEHRMYEQALIRHSRKSVTLIQRYRLEQRFIQYPANKTGSYTYQNRFRYMLKAEFPLTKRADGSREWYLPMYNEILLAIPPNIGARPFDQNRLFGGIGHSFGTKGNLELGYMAQFLGQRNGRIWELNNTLLVSFSSSLSLQKLRKK